MNRGPEEMADAPLGYQIWKLNNEMAAKMTAEKYALEIANKQVWPLTQFLFAWRANH